MLVNAGCFYVLFVVKIPIWHNEGGFVKILVNVGDPPQSIFPLGKPYGIIVFLK